MIPEGWKLDVGSLRDVEDNIMAGKNGKTIPEGWKLETGSP